MKRLLDKALTNYSQSDIIIQMKARFVLYTCLCILIIIPIVLLSTTYIHLHEPLQGFHLNLYVLIPEMAGFFIALVALRMLIRGAFTFSAHAILILALIITWFVIAMDSHGPLVTRLDTIVYVVAFLTMAPLMVTKHSKIIFVYAAVNILALWGFFYVFSGELALGQAAVIDCLTDNTIAFIFVAITAYGVFTINRKALERAREDIRERIRAEETVRLQKKELEAINQELSITVDKMAATTREYEETNERLLEAQSDILTAHARLKESEEKFSKAFHMNPLLVGLSTYPEGRFVDVSDSFALLSGYTREEMIGKTSMELHLWETPNELAAIKETLAVKTKVLDHEIAMLSRSGKRALLMLSAEVITIADEPHLVLVGIDTTERRQAEEENNKLAEQLRQAQKMESIGRLAGGVAHDFNNMLTAIIGNTELALIALEPEHTVLPRLKVVMKAAESAADLTRQLLAFSRKQIIEPKSIDLTELVRQMHNMLQRLIGEDIHLEIVSDPQVNAVKADPGQIQQMIVNLAVNARDAMPDGGKLIIGISNQVLDHEYSRRHPYTRTGDYVLLSVSDTGCGMSEEVKAHLFEPFFTTKPLGKGTGLGLATIYGAVKQHGGSIEVYSEFGQGTSFKIYFPRYLGDEVLVSEQPLQTDTELPPGQETILLVEDDAEVREYCIDILKHLGYAVIDADSGESALAIAAQHPREIHLLLTDVVLPGINGRILADKLAKERPKMRILFTSGYTENVIVHHGVLDQGIQFIGKPYTAHSLAVKIRDLLNNPAS